MDWNHVQAVASVVGLIVIVLLGLVVVWQISRNGAKQRTARTVVTSQMESINQIRAQLCEYYGHVKSFTVDYTLPDPTGFLQYLYALSGQLQLQLRSQGEYDNLIVQDIQRINASFASMMGSDSPEEITSQWKRNIQYLPDRLMLYVHAYLQASTDRARYEARRGRLRGFNFDGTVKKYLEGQERKLEKLSRYLGEYKAE
ncbi:hypothetical protein FACS189415_5520 [Bacteroidia bacterium]|nr:hypothetical protein FACS189415_5520 [Bacteroidia bacterium]